jgi:DNA-binding SARP family transcriptional activator/tetratricopeptide (TPR) repeat protein
VDDNADLGAPPRPSSRLEYRMLGRFEVRADGSSVDLGTPKQRAVLAILLLECGRVVPTDRLLELVWGDSTASTASLQSYISNLRRALEPARGPRQPATVLMTEPPGYRIVASRSAVDLFRFEDLVAEGGDLLHAGDARAALAAAERALSLWNGPPLPELADEPFVVAADARLGGVRMTALELAAQSRLDLGDHLGAIGLLEGPVAEHPLNERLHGLLALGLYRAGRQADALRMVGRVRRALADTAGLSPGPELRALESDLLAQQASLDWTRPTATSSVQDGTPRRPTAATTIGLPNTSESLVGRHREIESLVESLVSAQGGRGGAAIVMGEPGIGKTRLVEELLEIATAAGVTTATVGCPESGAIPSFWPVVQLADQVQRAGALVDALPVPESPSMEPPASLFALYEAVGRWLREAPEPLVLVIDDLQWADADTLRLVAHLAPTLRATRALVVVTVRPVVGDQSPALVDCLAALARGSGTVHVRLDGLTLDDVAEWLRRRTGHEVPAAVAATMFERTGGQPLFVKELSELASAEGRIDDIEALLANRAIPPGVQFVVRRRVSRLPAATQQLLSVASVVGRSFQLDVVAAVAGEPLDDALDALAPALDSGLVIDGGTADFRFSHALVAEALAAELNPARRARLHAATARTLAARLGPTFGPQAALVAHHALEGRVAGTGDLALRASTEAAQRAADGFGYDEAATHWERVVTTLESIRPGDLQARLEALHELAAARFRADMVRPAKDAALDAIALAEDIGDIAAQARAAALLGRPHLWPNQAYAEIDHRAVGALERTAAAVPPTQLVDRALVLGALAVELLYASAERFGRVRDLALEAARASGDPFALASVLVNVAGPLRPSELDLREALAEEVIELSATHGLPEDIELVGWFHRAIAAWDRAEFDTALEHVERCRVLAERIGGSAVRAQLTWYRGATALVRGEYEVAAQLGEEATALYRRTRGIDADVIELTLSFARAADLGGLDVFADQLLRLRHQTGHYRWLLACVTAWTLAECGRTSEAHEVLATIDPNEPLPDDYTTLCGAAMAVQACAEIGDATAATVIASRLEPYRGRWTQAGSGGCSAGLVDLALAQAASVSGDAAAARALFDSAVEGHERLRAPAWLARSLLHQGRFLLATGDPDDAALGRTALRRARELTVRHGLAPIARQVDAALGPHGSTAP